MPAEEKSIPPFEWQAIVDYVPLVSDDLVVEHDGNVCLENRENKLAEEELFMPGETVQQNEAQAKAVHCVA